MYSTQGAAIKAKKKAKREKEKRLETAETLQGKPQVNLNLQTPLLHRHPRRLHKTILRGGARNDVEFFKNEQPFLSESFFPLSFPYHRSLSLSLSLSQSSFSEPLLQYSLPQGHDIQAHGKIASHLWGKVIFRAPSSSSISSVYTPAPL